MMMTLLVVILISFIGVGLPDSVLGTAWPAMYLAFDLPISFAGYITAAVSVGTILSSLMSARLIARFGTGLVSAVSTALTALALFGFALTQHPALFFLLAVPMGIGAGAIDTALNAFVALHYSASAMSFLHCFYGLGVAASPFVMSLALGPDSNWRQGYWIIACIQLGIAVLGFLSLPLWHRVEGQGQEDGGIPQKQLSLLALLKTPGVLLSGLAFVASCGLELTAGGWSSSYFVLAKGLAPDRAAMITMVFYIGLSAGRFVSGLCAARLGRRRLLRISLFFQLLAVSLFLLPAPIAISALALFLIGFGIGPVYPNLMHLTPKNFGEDMAQAVMGVQQALTYIGVMVIPWLFGTLAQVFSAALLPPFLLLLLLLYAVIYLSLMHTVQKRRRK